MRESGLCARAPRQLSELPYTLEAAEAAAQALDADEIRSKQEQDDLRNAFIARDGRTEEQQLLDLLNHARNALADHMATHGCFKCARAFVRGFTSTGPNPEQFCTRGMTILVRIATITKAMMAGEPDDPVSASSGA